MSIQSLERAFDILELIASHNTPVPLKTIAEEMDLSVSTVHNLVRTMVNRGYIQHVGARGGFVLGYELVELAAVVPVQFQISDVVKPYVVDLYDRSEKESTYFSVIRKDIISTEIYIPSSYALSVSLGTDTLDKLYCSAQGKVFLAYMSETHLNKYFRSHELTKMGPNTITNEAVLRKELELTRTRGYALNEEESELGAAGLAAPVLDGAGHLLGVLAVGLPAIRMKEKRDRLITTIVEISQQVTKKVFELNQQSTISSL